MLELNNLEVTYRTVIQVLRGVSIELADSQIICLIGANGAGKTTTLRAISGLLKSEVGEISKGNIMFNGVRIDGKRTQEIVKMGIIQVIEGRRLFEHLTIEENLKASAYAFGNSTPKDDIDSVYDYFPRLKSLHNRTAGYLSGGEQQMLVIGSALMAHPKVMLLDEPSLGLSPLLVKSIFQVIEKINIQDKTSILLVEQNAMAAMNLAGYGYVMENGRVVLDGPTDKLKDNDDVKEFYLGLNMVGEKKSYKDIKHYKRRKRWLG